MSNELLQELVDAMEEARELIKGYVDVKDGPYSEPEANSAMKATQLLDDAIKLASPKTAGPPAIFKLALSPDEARIVRSVLVVKARYLTDATLKQATQKAADQLDRQIYPPGETPAR